MFAGIQQSFSKRITDYALRRWPDGAFRGYRRMVARYTRRYGPDHWRTLVLRGDYAVALHRHGETEPAEGELAEVIERATATDASQAFIHKARTLHARMLFDLRRFADAEREFRALSLECEQRHGSDHPDTVGAHEDHAAALFRLDRLQEAEAEAADVVARRTASQGADSKDTLRARSSHAQ